MHLVVDAQALQTSSARRGIGRYARNLLQALVTARPAWRVAVALNAALPPPARGTIPSAVTVRWFSPPLPMAPDSRRLNEQYFGDWIAAPGADVVLELSVFDEEALVPRFVAPRPWLVGMAYDLVPVLFHEHYLRHPAAHAIYRVRFRQALEADLLLAISETTRQDVLRLMRLSSDRVVTIGGAAEPTGRVPAPDSARRAAVLLDRAGIDRPFLLYVGGTDPRKNLRGALAAFATLPPESRAAHCLVIVCGLTADQRSALEADAAALGIGNQLRLTGYVDDDDLQALYDTCRLSIFPSFYEGLGLPVLEALMSGAPVVASDRSSIPEFAGDAVRLADPASPPALAAAIQAELGVARAEGERQRRASAGRFTWDSAAGRAAAAIERLPTRPPARASARPRIAWVSPVPPADAPSARLSARLLPRLREWFEVALVVGDEATLAPAFVRGLETLRPGDVWSSHVADPFDLFVFHVAQDERHQYVRDLACWRSGLVVLHDATVPTGGAGASARAVAGSEAVIVHGSATWRSVRQATTPSVFCVPDDDAAGAAYGAAIRLTIATRQAHDGEWCDVASSALAAAALPPGRRDALIDDWVAVRITGTDAARG